MFANRDFMNLNGMPTKIDSGAGDYLVLPDYGQDGISVSAQFNSAQEALQWILTSAYSNQHAIVKLVEVTTTEKTNQEI